MLMDLLPIIIVAAVMALLWLALRNKATPLESVAELDSRIGNGRPVVIRFYKNT